MGKAFFQIAGVVGELERSMINARTKAGIEKAKIDGVKFGRTLVSKNPKTAAKIERIKIFLRAGKSYEPSFNLQLALEKSEIRSDLLIINKEK